MNKIVGFINGLVFSKDIPETLQREEEKLGIDFVCEARGEGNITCYGIECKAHIITQHFIAMKVSEFNIIKICKAHEQYFNSPHLGILTWFDFVKKNFPEKCKMMRSQLPRAEKQLQRAQYVLKEYEIFMEATK